jgi:hypothetical protein
MDFAMMHNCLEIVVYAALALALGAAIFFWGRGIRNGRKSDLVAGPAILVALCITLLVVIGISSVFMLIGGLLFVFGIATLVLSRLARVDGTFCKRNVIAIGAGLAIAGVCLSLII